MLSAHAADYLEDRGFDLELVLRYGAESKAPRGASSGEWIAFPFVQRDRVVNHEYRCIEPKLFRRDAGGAMCFWNESVLDDVGLADEPLIIAEGIFDALSLIQAGFQRTVSMPNGSQSEKREEGETATRYKFLEEVKDKLHPERIPRIILACDADAKGFALTEDLSAFLGASRCKFVPYPDGCKDANDVLVRFGAGRLKQCVEGARWIHVAGVRTFSDYPPGADAAPEVWRTGISAGLDKRFGVLPGYISISTGIPSHGKTQFLKQVTWSLLGATGGMRDGEIICRDDAPVSVAAVASFEEKMPREYAQSALQYLIGRKREGWVGLGGPWTRQERDAGMAWLDAHVIPIDPHGYAERKGRLLEEVEPTVDWLLDAIRTAVVRHQARFVVVDPWSDIVQERGRGQSEHEYIGETLGRFKRAARVLKAHIHIAAHPRKVEKRRDGGYDAPGPYEISGSAHWFNAPTLGWTIHREPARDPETKEPLPGDTRTMVDVWKSKFQSDQGKPGKCFLQFSPARGKFEGE